RRSGPRVTGWGGSGAGSVPCVPSPSGHVPAPQVTVEPKLMIATPPAVRKPPVHKGGQGTRESGHSPGRGGQHAPPRAKLAAYSSVQTVLASVISPARMRASA